MVVTENHSGLQINELLGTAKRENNKKRKNLFVNYYQGKHFPAKGSEALQIFRKLAERIILPDDKPVMIIGFAETATAIAASVASNVGNNCTFIHTSREKISSELCVADFSEEHSHASKQYLFSSDKEEIFKGVRHIVFVEDEITTGKTILNFVNVLKKIVEPGCRFYAAAIVNGMNDASLETYRSLDIGLFWLVKIEDSIEYMNRELDISSNEDMKPFNRVRNVFRYDFDGIINPRLGCKIEDYMPACKSFAEEIIGHLKELDIEAKTIDVIGTEEFMYPAIYLAEKLEKIGYIALSHSTTRSPIIPSDSFGYPLKNRYRFHSMYEYDRVTYLYNLYKCDAALILTDADNGGEAAMDELVGMLDTPNVIIVSWRNR